MKRAALTQKLFLIVMAASFLLGSVCAAAWDRFERTYNTRRPAHLTITNTQGEIIVSTWNRRTVSVRADVTSPAIVEDRVAGDDINITVKAGLRLGRANFEVFVPADTSLTLSNVVGQIDVKGLTGQVSIKSFNSNVKLTNINSPSVNVLVTSGNLFFDGELQKDGFYSLQSMKGDIDISIPTESSFRLTARALSENINLGGFTSNLSGIGKGSKEVTGTYRNGGPKLNITAFAGRILFHKK